MKRRIYSTFAVAALLTSLIGGAAWSADLTSVTEPQVQSEIGTLSGGFLADSCTSVRARLPQLRKEKFRHVGCLKLNNVEAVQELPSSRKTAQNSAPSTRASAASLCVLSGNWQGSRFEMCGGGHAELDWMDPTTGGLIGAAQFEVTQHLVLDAQSRNFTEDFSIKTTATAGVLTGASLNLAVSCDATCSATNNFPQGAPITSGSTVSATINYTDSTNAVHLGETSYSLSWGQGTATPVDWKAPNFRCDNVQAGFPAGCVVPGIRPVMTSMATLPNIRANIQRIQGAGTLHYGRAAGGEPLTRNSDAANGNRAAVCAKQTSPDPGVVSCDEYLSPRPIREEPRCCRRTLALPGFRLQSSSLRAA